MHDQLRLADSVAQLDYFEVHIASHSHPAIVLLAKDQRLAMFELDHLIILYSALGEHIKSVIVEYVTVLVDLDKRNAFVMHRALDDHLQVLDVRIDRAP